MKDETLKDTNMKLTTKRIVGVGMLMGSLFVANGCGTANKQATSEVKVTNGKKINEQDFPEVAFLTSYPVTESGFVSQGFCTGTFVNDHQMLTAAHCVEGLDPQNPALYYLSKPEGSTKDLEYQPQAKALSFVQHPNYSMRLEGGINQFDMAVVDFPAGTAPAVSQVTETKPKTGDVLTIVGYGDNRNFATLSGEFEGSGSGIKRIGTNQVAFLDADMIGFYGVTESNPELEPGEYSASGAGDSGGPLFIDGKLAGITSGGGLAQTEDGYLVGVSLYVDLTSQSSEQFLQMYLDSK